MSNQTSLAVSVVTYQTNTSLLEALCKSLSPMRDQKMIIVDNGRQDLIRDFCVSNKIEYVRPERNLGFGSAHNLAIDRYAAEAKYFLILNPDVVVHPGAINTIIDFMDKNDRVVLCAPKILNSDGSLQRVHRRLPTPYIMMGRRFFPKLLPWLTPKPFDLYELKDLNMEVSHEVPCVSGCFMFFRSVALLKLGGFDERYFMYQEDIDISRRAHSLGKVIYLPSAVITHHWARGSHKNFKLMWFNISSAIKYFLKWGLNRDIEPKVFEQKTGG